MRYKTASTSQPLSKKGAGISRHQFLSISAATLFGLSVSAGPLQASPNVRFSKLKLGISTLGFSGFTNAALAKEIAEAGIRVVQLFLNQTDSRFWNYNGRADVSAMTPARCREISAAYGDAGISIDSIGVYTNLIHPDAAERKANLEYFQAMMNIGGHMGVHRFISEAGHFRHPKEPEPEVPFHFQDGVWLQMIATVQQLAVMAEKYQAKVLLEPFFRGFFASAKRLRMFLEEVRSPFIRALLDPANLIEVNDLDEMFHQLGSWVDCLHAKDRKLHTDRGVAAGKGDLDYPKFVKLAAKHSPAAPLILEYVGPEDYRDALSHLRRVMREAGLSEE
jgi:sugar phosphate isomerase/epimerase